MRALMLCLAVLVTGPAFAELAIKPAACAPDSNCLAAFTLSGLAASPSRPVVRGDTLVVSGIGPGPTGAPTSLMAVRLALTGPPALAGVTTLDATGPERPSPVEVAPDGTAYAVFTTDDRDHLNRNRRVAAIQFFDVQGQRQGRVVSPYLADWPAEVEWSPADLMGAQAGTNSLQFADGKMTLRLGRFDLSAGLADGRMELVEVSSGPEMIEDVVNILFDPVGVSQAWAGPGVTGVFTYASDGSPAVLGLVRTDRETPPDVMAPLTLDLIQLEPNEADYSRSYEAVTLSPDGTLLAALRLDNSSCDPTPMPYALVVYDTASGQLLWSHAGVRQGVVQQDLTFTPDNHLILTEAWGAVDPPCGPTDESPSILVTLYDPRP